MTDTSSLSQRRRSRAFVTKNACTECRKRKARCDGRSPCARCTSLEGATCHYTVSVRVSKESMKADIEALQAYRRMAENILGSLAGGKQLDFILQSLREGDPLEDISSSLGRQLSFGGISSSSQIGWPLSPGPSRTVSWSTATSSSWEPIRDCNHLSLRCGFTGRDEREEQIHGNGEQWTAVTMDYEVIEHLLSLYFCWEYPTFAIISKKQFLEDFRAGRYRYCSSLLVNSILALGCRFSDQFETKADSKALGNRFYAEAERLWAVEQDIPSLTTIQAMALMSHWEASRGRENKGWFYSRQAICMAVEMGLHVQVNDMETSKPEHEVRSITFWGAFALDQAWSLSLGRIPHVSRKGVRIGIPTITETEEQSEWIPYTDNGALLERTLHQPSNVHWVYRGLCELSEIVHDSLHILYSPGRPLTSRDVLNAYTRYLHWYDSLPVAVRRGENSTPAVLFVHMYYHFAILLLFGPFIKLRLLGSSVSPNEICIQAADAITSLVRSYRQLYSLRRTCCFVPYIVLASSIMHLVATDSSVPNVGAFNQIFQSKIDLQEMVPSSPFATRGKRILRVMAQNRSVEMSQAGEDRSMNDEKDKCAPVPGSINFSSPDMENITPTRYSYTQISIFSPFPTQVLPLPAFEKQLERDGFLLIK